MITGEQVKAAGSFWVGSLERLAEEAALAKKALELFESGMHLAMLHVGVLSDVLASRR